MKKTLLGIALALGMITASPSAFAEWQFEQFVDSMTDEQISIARVTSEDNHHIQIYSPSNSRSVWMTFSVDDASFDQIDPEKLIILRADSHDAFKLDGHKLIEEISNDDMLEWDPQNVDVKVLADDAQRPVKSGFLFDLATGERLRVRFYLASGGYEETTFSLEGAGSTIRKATGAVGNMD